MALCSLSIKLIWLNQRCVVYDHGKPPCSLNGMLWFVVRSARETTMIRPWRLAVTPWDMGVATDATRWDSKSAGAWAMFGRQLGEPLFLIGGRESRPLRFAAFWKYKLGLWMKHRCLDSSSEISVSSGSILYPAGRSESSWFPSRPSKAQDRERERECSCSKSQTLNQTLSRGTFSVIIHFYSNLFRAVPLSNYLIRTLGTSPLVEFVARCLLPCVRFRWGVRGQKLWRSNSVAVSCGVARWGSLGRVHVG